MSNYEALGFSLSDRREAEGLARAPLRLAEPRTVLLAEGPVSAHRLDTGDGIELWTIVRGRTVVASYPSFRARGRREVEIARVTTPNTPYTPRVWLAPPTELAFHLVNLLEVPAAALTAGTLATIGLVGVAGDGLAPTRGPVGLGPPVGIGNQLAENVVSLRGVVRAAELLHNTMSGAAVAWLALDCGAWGTLEVVAAGDRAPLELGATLEGQVTLRGEVLALPAVGWRAESEEARV